jgi:hypothetical protein
VNSTKSREVICGGRITAAKINAAQARKQAIEATRDADRAEAQCLNAGYGFLEVKCKRSDTKASIPLDALRRAPNTPIWKLEASLKFRSCRRGRYAPPVHMIRPTEERFDLGEGAPQNNPYISMGLFRPHLDLSH